MKRSELKKQRKKQIKDFKLKREEVFRKKFNRIPEIESVEFSEAEIEVTYVSLATRLIIQERTNNPSEYRRILREEKIRILRDRRSTTRR